MHPILSSGVFISSELGRAGLLQAFPGAPKEAGQGSHAGPASAAEGPGAALPKEATWGSGREDAPGKNQRGL